MKALALVLALWCVTSTALATDRSMPFELSCPDVKKCWKSESGSWIPAWYGREIAKESAYLDGVREELDRARKESDELRRALEASQKESATLTRSVVTVESARKALELRYAAHERRLVRRTRWALGATVIGVLLAGALGAGIYVAGH